MKIAIRSLFLSFLIFGPLGQAGAAEKLSAQQEFLLSFSSENFRVLPRDVTPQKESDGFLGWFFQFFKRQPEIQPAPWSVTCQPQVLEKALFEHPQASVQSLEIRDYLNRCRDEIETGVRGRVRNTYEHLRYRYDDLNHPFIRRVEIRLPGEVRLQALLALKGDQQKRPWVILRLGIFGNIEEYFAENFVFRQLFEEGPFNVLVVESSTSQAYLRNNPGFALGGSIEGLQNIQLARLLRNPQEPISQLVQSLHLVGVSLGGHGLIHAAALDALQDGPALFQSHLGLCPVVQFKKTVYDRWEWGLENTVADFWMSHRTPALSLRAPMIRERSPFNWLKLEPYYWRGAVEYAASVHPVAPGLAKDIKALPHWESDFWKASEPWGNFQNLKAPVLVMATRDDDVVPVDLNAQALIKEIYRKGLTEDLGVVIFEQGYHCTLPAAYHWRISSAILNAVVTARTSRSWEILSREFDVHDLVKNVPLSKVETSYGVNWPQDQVHPQVRVHLKAGDLFTEIPFEIKKTELDFQFHNDSFSEVERQMSAAWISANLRMDFETKGSRTVLRVTWRKWLAGRN